MNSTLQNLISFAFAKRNINTHTNLYNMCNANTNVVKKLPHTPVMAEETLKYINLSPGDTMIDMTFGAGGHSSLILENFPNVKIFALDRDPVAIDYATKLGEKYPGQVIPLLGKFSDLLNLLKPYNVTNNSIDAILCDFGTSSMQFDTPERGFALSNNGPLDMGMDGSRETDCPSVAEVLAKIDEYDLYRIIKYYGEEKRAKKIAQVIIESREKFRNLKTTKELAQLIESIFPSEFSSDKLGRFQHSATKTFQALRIFVNNELNEINYAMLIAENLLKVHGRLIAISFHSLEDTIVKRHLAGNVYDAVANKLPLKYINYNKIWMNKEELQELTESCWEMLHKHIILPSDLEIEENPRARSARFRAIVKIK